MRSGRIPKDTQCGPSDRIVSIDLLRGLIMALMALDHARAFFLGSIPDPTDLATTTAPLFATRWVTHLCAPGFLLLAGAAARLQLPDRGATSLALLLVTRGAFLIALELTLVGFAWIPDPGSNLFLLQVIWAIGWSMILLAPLVVLPPWFVGLLGVGLAVAHPVLSTLAGAVMPPWLVVILFDSAATLSTGTATEVIVSYAILPWFAVMAAGYGFGGLIARDSGWSGKTLRIGLGLILAFVVLRAVGSDLDPEPWRSSLERPVLAFLNCEKYPPSPLFLAMTLGPLLVLLATFERRGLWRMEGLLLPLGRAPLFFYVLHLYVLRAGGLAAAAIVWGPENLGPPPLPSTPEWPLPAVWLVWALSMPVLYWSTRWFAEVKRRRHGGWTAYL